MGEALLFLHAGGDQVPVTQAHIKGHITSSLRDLKMTGAPEDAPNFNLGHFDHTYIKGVITLTLFLTLNPTSPVTEPFAQLQLKHVDMFSPAGESPLLPYDYIVHYIYYFVYYFYYLPNHPSIFPVQGYDGAGA